MALKSYFLTGENIASSVLLVLKKNFHVVVLHVQNANELYSPMVVPLLRNGEAAQFQTHTVNLQNDT